MILAEIGPVTLRFDQIGAADDGPAALAGHQADLERYRRMRSPRRRRQFVAGRRLLRAALSAWLPADAPPWTLHAEADRAPVLHGEGSDFPLPRISLSHSGDWVCCALAQVERLGVDCEAARLRDWLALGEAMLHPGEILERQSVPEDGQTAWHLARWTAKEALLKACGAGLAAGMPAIRLAPGLAPLVAPPDVPPPLADWRIVHLIPVSGLHVAVAWREASHRSEPHCEPGRSWIPSVPSLVEHA